MKDSFWNSHYENFDIQEPSRFAKYCINQQLNKNNLVVELGCGNGRDGFALLKKTGRYVGVDDCPIAIERLSKKIENMDGNLSNRMDLICNDFTTMDFENLSSKNEKLFFYSRFSYYSISYLKADGLLQSLDKLTCPWVMMMEVRAIYDEFYGEGVCLGEHEFKTDHYRRFIDPQEFISNNVHRFSFKYFELGRNFAPFKKENPLILRIIFQPKGTNFE